MPNNARYDCTRHLGRKRTVPLEVKKPKPHVIEESTKLKIDGYKEAYSIAVSTNADNMLDFAIRMHKISAIWLDIIQYLHKSGGVFVGDYSDLTVALGRNPGPYGHASNIRKSVVELTSKGIISVQFKKGHRPEIIFLNPNWMSII